MAMSDEEILEELREQGEDPVEHASRMRAVFEEAVHMANQTPSVGRVVHFVHGDQHYAAIITAVYSREIQGDKPPVYGQTLYVIPPMDQPFSTVAELNDACVPGTWHWPEYMP